MSEQSLGQITETVGKLSCVPIGLAAMIGASHLAVLVRVDALSYVYPAT